MPDLNRTLQTLFWIGVYAAFGMAGYSQFVGDLVDPTSAQFWAWLGAWPAMLFMMFSPIVLKVIGWAILIVFIIFMILWIATAMGLIKAKKETEL